MGSHAVIVWQFVAAVTAVGGVFSVYLGTVIRSRDHPVAHDLGWFTTLVGCWAAATAGALLSPSAAIGAVLWERVVPILTFIWIPYWVLFSVRYVGHDTFSSARRRALLFVPVVGLSAAALSPLATPLVFEDLTYVQWNGLYVREFRPGVVYTATNVFRYIGGATGALVMAQFLQNSRNIYRRQTALILAVPLIGMAGGILFQVGLSPHPGIKLPPLLVTVQAPLLALVVFRYEFLNLKPVAPNRAIEEMLDPVVVVDDDHALVDFNPAAAETFGFTDDCYGEPVGSLVDAATGTMSLEDISMEGTQTDGGAAPVFDSNSAPIRDQYGRDKGSVLVFRNITELKQREQALERQNERLDKFAAMVSHDLRNPMSVANGNLELARETGAPERFDATEQALARMDEIIEDMLTIARADRRVDDPGSVSPAVTAPGVAIKPGATQLTRTPSAAHSLASDLVRLLTPAFAAP